MTDPVPEQPTNLGEIVVTGIRPRPGEPRNDLPTEEQDELDPNADPQPGGGGVWTAAEAEAEAERQKECAASNFEKNLNATESARKDKKEFFSLIWGRSGQTATHAPRGGTADRITGAEIRQAMTDFNIPGSDLIGYSHNHPSDIYCSSSGAMGFDEERANSYPSANDWNAVDSLVPAEFRVGITLFILGCDNQMRSFKYTERAQAERDRDQRTRPPAPIAPQGCPQ